VSFPGIAGKVAIVIGHILAVDGGMITCC